MCAIALSRQILRGSRRLWNAGRNSVSSSTAVLRVPASSRKEEAAFLALKSAIVQEHETLVTLLNVEGMREDKAMRLLNAVPSLASFRGLPEGTDKRLAAEWHSTLLALQALLGRLKGRQIQLAAISSVRVGWKNVFSHPTIVLLLLVCSGYGVYRFAVDWVPKVIELLEKR